MNKVNKFDLGTMFDVIKSGLADSDTKSNNVDYSNILKFEIGKTYKLRLLPFVGEPSKTFWHYYEFGWNSKATDQYVSAITPSTWGEPCPINEVYRKAYRDKIESGIRRGEKWLVNVYVINDPTNPENNGKVKIMRYGKQIDKIIKEATTGDLQDDLGKYIFDLGSNGYDFIVKVDKQQEYANYSSSSFARRPSAIEGIEDDEEKIRGIYESAFDLSTLFPVKSYDALKKMLDEHYYVSSRASTVVESEPEIETSVSEQPKYTEPTSTTSTMTSDEELDKLIADL